MRTTKVFQRSVEVDTASIQVSPKAWEDCEILVLHPANLEPSVLARALRDHARKIEEAER